MTNEERDLITRFIERVGGAAPSGFGSVPSAGQPGLAPVDPDADALIGQLMAKYPEARYRITQLAFVQEHALNAAQQRITALQAQLQQAQTAAQQTPAAPSPWGAGAQPQQAQQPPQSRGFFGNLFGGGPQPAPHPGYPPQQQYAPQYAPPGGMFQPQGTGFLGGALRTAAGVAGGLVAGQALMNLFSGHGAGFGGFGSGAAMPGAGFGPEAGLGTPGGWVDAGPGSAGPGGVAPDPNDQGGALKSDPGTDPFAQGAADNSGWTSVPDPSGPDAGWQQAAPDNGGWQDAPPDDGGNWDTGGDDGGWTDSSSDA